MRKQPLSKFSLFLNVVLILFLILYFLVPFLNNSFLTTIVKPTCAVINMFQGEAYLPSWCEETTKPTPKVNNNVNQPVNINLNLNTNTNLNTDNKAGIANPAAVKCLDDGGTSFAYQTSGGEAALCVFKDKSICEEWAYFRAECKPGQCLKECQHSGQATEGWYNSCTKELIEKIKCAPVEATTPPADKPTEPVTQPANANIKVSLPQANEQLSSPFKVEGQAIVKDNMIYVRVKSKEGTVLIQEDVKAVNQTGSEWANFSLELSYEFTRTKEGFVEVYSLDANDKEVNLLSIPVKF